MLYTLKVNYVNYVQRRSHYGITQASQRYSHEMNIQQFLYVPISVTQTSNVMYSCQYWPFGKITILSVSILAAHFYRKDKHFNTTHQLLNNVNNSQYYVRNVIIDTFTARRNVKALSL